VGRKMAAGQRGEEIATGGSDNGRGGRRRLQRHGLVRAAREEGEEDGGWAARGEDDSGWWPTRAATVIVGVGEKAEETAIEAVVGGSSDWRRLRQGEEWQRKRRWQRWFIAAAVGVAMRWQQRFAATVGSDK
ncbi:hypothetical protein GW17_00050353, partial [Ensete ventricosum]